MMTLQRKYNSVDNIINKDGIRDLFIRIEKLKRFEINLWEDDESIYNQYRALDHLNIIEVLKDAIQR